MAFSLLLRHVTVGDKRQHSRSVDSAFRLIFASRADTHYSRSHLWSLTNGLRFDFLAFPDSSRFSLFVNICRRHQLIGVYLGIFGLAAPRVSLGRNLSHFELFPYFLRSKMLPGGYGHILTSTHGWRAGLRGSEVRSAFVIPACFCRS